MRIKANQEHFEALLPYYTNFYAHVQQDKQIANMSKEEKEKMTKMVQEMLEIDSCTPPFCPVPTHTVRPLCPCIEHELSSDILEENGKRKREHSAEDAVLSPRPDSGSETQSVDSFIQVSSPS